MRIKEAAECLGVCTETLRKWDRAGIINTDRTPLGHRIFTPEAILEIQRVIRNKKKSSSKGRENELLT